MALLAPPELPIADWVLDGRGGGGLAGGVLRVGGGGRAGGTQHKRAGLAGAGDIPAAIAINKSYNAAGGGVRGA